MDFNLYNVKAAAEKGIPVTILSPGSFQPMKDDEGVEIVITVYGTDSKRWIDESDIAKSEYGDKDEMPQDEIDATIKRVLAKCTMSWTGLIELNGEALTCTPENAEKLYCHEGLEWISQQLLAAVGNRRLLFLGLPNG